MVRMFCVFVATLAVMASVARAQTSHVVDELKSGRDQTIVVFGTSLTQGGAWPKQVETWLNGLGHKGKATVLNKGLSGSDTQSHGLRHLDRDVIALKPDVVFVEFGMNDCIQRDGDKEPKVPLEKFKENLGTIVDRIRKEVPKAEIILLTMNPAADSEKTPNSGKFRAALLDYYEAVRGIGKTKKLLVIDTYAAWKEVDAARVKRLIPDGVHPSAAGNEAVTTPAIKAALTHDGQAKGAP